MAAPISATITARYMGGLVNPDGWQVVTIHSTESGTKAGTARNIAAYFAGGTVKSSAHEAIDVAEAVQCVPENRIAFHCGNGNRFGYALELCARAAFSPLEWLAITPTLVLGAGRAALRLHKMGVRTAKWLTHDEMRRGVKGLVTHDDCRVVWGGTTHTDPGPNFPKDLFRAWTQEALDELWGTANIPGKTGTTPAPAPTHPMTPVPAGDWFDMATLEDLRAVVLAVVDGQGITGAADVNRQAPQWAPLVKQWVAEAMLPILRSEGISGAADVSRLAPAIAEALRGELSVDISPDAVARALTVALAKV